MLARTVCKWHPYDRNGQGMKVKEDECINTPMSMRYINVTLLNVNYIEKIYLVQS